MKKTFYLAYGSNMSIEQMIFRCPNAEFVKVTTLHGYRLVFCGRDNGYATIVPDAMSQIPVMVWQINREDELALDEYEDYPHLYRKEMLELDGQKMMVYIMNEQFTFKQPSASYFEIIEKAYLANNLDTSNLHHALKESLRKN